MSRTGVLLSSAWHRSGMGSGWEGQRLAKLRDGVGVRVRVVRVRVRVRASLSP